MPAPQLDKLALQMYEKYHKPCVLLVLCPDTQGALG